MGDRGYEELNPERKAHFDFHFDCSLTSSLLKEWRIDILTEDRFEKKKIRSEATLWKPNWAFAFQALNGLAPSYLLDWHSPDMPFVIVLGPLNDALHKALAIHVQGN